MPKTPPTPSYRKQKNKTKNRAFVVLGERRVYLGEYGTPDSLQRYDRVVAEWLQRGRQAPPPPPDDITVVEILARYWHHANAYYRRPDGSVTAEVETIRQALRPMRELYGRTPVAEFGPLALETVRQRMIEAGWCRSHVNKQISRVKLAFKWGVSKELAPPRVYQAIACVAGLKRGRSEVRDSEPVKPVPEAHIEAVKPLVSRQVRALIDLQLLTGARGGELRRMRAVDVDTAGNVWTFSPDHHKTAHHGHKRTILIGPKGQTIIREFTTRRPIDAYLFSPRDAEAERLEAKHRARKTPISCGNRPGTNRKPTRRRPPGERYTKDSYRRAIHRGCDRADRAVKRDLADADKPVPEGRIVPRWSPHRLRHNAATWLRHEYGIDIAQTILGHRLGSGITEIYAEANIDKARAVIAQAG